MAVPVAWTAAFPTADMAATEIAVVDTTAVVLETAAAVATISL
jgi:hypothetical protein